jgi:hypothetical protein
MPSAVFGSRNVINFINSFNRASGRDAPRRANTELLFRKMHALNVMAYKVRFFAKQPDRWLTNDKGQESGDLPDRPDMTRFCYYIESASEFLSERNPDITDKVRTFEFSKTRSADRDCRGKNRSGCSISPSPWPPSWPCGEPPRWATPPDSVCRPRMIDSTDRSICSSNASA